MIETTRCRKCEREHRVEEYRGVKYYVCPEANRVLLLTEEKKDDTDNRGKNR
jgi:hypothetical protein